MTIHITRPDVEWLIKLYKIVSYVYEDYPELFSKEDEETMKVAGELIRSLQ